MFNGKKVVGMALSLACAFSLYSASAVQAESESGGFIAVGIGGSESGGVMSAGGYSESGGVVDSGAETESGALSAGAESESGGVMSNGSESEAGLGHDSTSASGGQPVEGYVPNFGVKTYKW